MIFKFSELKEQFRGIYNEPKCELINNANIDKICDYDDIALVWPLNQVNEYVI